MPTSGLRAPNRPVLARSPNRSVVAHSSAERRWTSDLMNLLLPHPDQFALALDHIDEDLKRSATAAELKRRGTGIHHVLDASATWKELVGSHRWQASRCPRPYHRPPLRQGLTMVEPVAAQIAARHAATRGPVGSLCPPSVGRSRVLPGGCPPRGGFGPRDHSSEAKESWVDGR